MTDINFVLAAPISNEGVTEFTDDGYVLVDFPDDSATNQTFDIGVSMTCSGSPAADVSVVRLMTIYTPPGFYSKSP
jgi:hypothetical protein